MLPYLEWMDTKGFIIRDAWDEEKQINGGVGKMILFPRQRRILDHALAFNDKGLFNYDTVLYSDIKKTGKSVIAASVGAWYAEEAKDGSEIFVIANTLEQGEGRVMRDIKFHFERRQKELGKKFCKIGQYRIDFPNGTFIQVLAQSYKSVAGSRHALTLFDELWGSTSEFDRRMWDEMVPIPTVPLSMRFISSYAGFENESDLLWERYLTGVGKEEHIKGQGIPVDAFPDLPCWKNGGQFTYWSHDSDLPWYTDEFLDRQQQTERPAAFLRLFTNQWVTSHEEFIPIEWWDIAAKAYDAPATLWDEHPFKHWPVTVAIDAGIRRDSSALVVVGYDSHRGKVGLLHHKIWTPSEGDPIDLEKTVEAELGIVYNKFRVVSIVYDPTHILPTMMRLHNQGMPTKLFEQTTSNMTAASQLLYELLKGRNLEAYPTDDLRRHIQMSVAETSSRGFRIVKTRAGRRHHIDGAVALAMACYEAVQNGGVDISVPIRIESPYADATAWGSKHQEDLPFELRSSEADG